MSQSGRTPQVYRFPPMTLVVLLLASAAADDDLAAVPELRFEPIDVKRSRAVPVKVHLGKSRAPQPVVLFSHGLGGSRENNAYLGTKQNQESVIESLVRSGTTGQEHANFLDAAEIQSPHETRCACRYIVGCVDST